MSNDTNKTGSPDVQFLLNEATANARVVCEILQREFNFEVSRSRVRIWLAQLEKRHEQENI